MSPLKRSNHTAARIGRWSANHWKTAVVGWLVFVVASVAVGNMVGTQYLKTNDTNVGEARKADKIIAAGFKAKEDEQGEIVLIQSKTSTPADPAFRAAINDVTTTLAQFPSVTKLKSPLAPSHRDQISDNGHAVMVTFSPKGDYLTTRPSTSTTIEAAVAKAQARHPGFTVEELGSVSTEKKLDAKFNSMLAKVGLLALPAALIILLLVFGSAVAAIVPLLLALTAVLATIGLVALPSQLIPVDQQISEVILLIGLAVGIDYSLFYLRREREERAAGRSEGAALEAAAATSGRAVLISGITVMIAMAGMFLSGDKTFMSFSVGTMMVVFVAMIGSLTVLPALLSKLGDRVEKGRIPFVHRLRSKNGESRVWGAILDRVLRRPVVSAVAAGAVLVALAAPAFVLNTATTTPSQVNIPEVAPIQHLEKAFGSGNDPARVAVKAADVTAPPVRAAIADLKRRALASGQMNAPITVDTNADHTVATVDIPLAGNGADSASKGALADPPQRPAAGNARPGRRRRLRGHRIDGRPTRTGAQSMTRTAPLVFGFVLIFAFLILTAAFRSIVVATKAVVLNLLSVAAAYGILVMVFQWGWGESVLNFHSNGGITPVAADVPVRDPVRALDGLPRVHPEPGARGLRPRALERAGRRARDQADRRCRHQRRRRHGRHLRGLRDDADHRLQGDGHRPRGRHPHRRDARSARCSCPATMKLLGDRNWYLPRWLKWLPKLEHDETPQAPAPTAIPAPAV